LYIIMGGDMPSDQVCRLSHQSIKGLPVNHALGGKPARRSRALIGSFMFEVYSKKETSGLDKNILPDW